MVYCFLCIGVGDRNHGQYVYNTNSCVILNVKLLVNLYMSSEFLDVMFCYMSILKKENILAAFTTPPLMGFKNML